MGTGWSIACAGRAIDSDRLGAAIVARLGDLIDQLSHWEPRSAISRFNRAPAGRWETLPPDLAAVLSAALDLAMLSGGAFDPAVGRLVDLLGFGPTGLQPQPDAREVAEALAAGTAARLAYDRAARRLRQPGGLALDLSGIGKGHAVDALGTTLDGLGVADWLVEIGGELKGSGMRPDGDPWWVDLEVPPGHAVHPLRIALHGLAVATSGDYRRGAHTLDPRTGRSVANGVCSVSVLHANAMLADGWATVLTVLGPADGMALAASHGIAARLLVAREGGLVEHLTPGLAAMLEEDRGDT